jgi:hypothetical protein
MEKEDLEVIRIVNEALREAVLEERFGELLVTLTMTTFVIISPFLVSCEDFFVCSLL